jgi:LacI family transcriptional regulator
LAVTMRDVAREADVSVATVSLVINNKNSINAKTRKRVLAAVEKLGYVRSRPSRELRGRSPFRNRAVGVLAPRQNWDNDASIFAQRILLGIERELSRLSFHCVFGSFDPAEKDAKLPMMLDGQGVDGVILVLGAHRDWVLRLMGAALRNAIPTVLVSYPGEEFNVPCVEIENLEAACRATSHLAECNYPKVATITGPADSPSARARLRGYRLAVAERGLPTDEALVRPSNYLECGGYREMARLLEEVPPPFGLFAGNDLMARGALNLLAERGIKVPEEVGIVGFDDIENITLKTTPALSTMRVPYEDMGVQAARQLVGPREGSRVSPRVTMPASLVLRGTTPPDAVPGGPTEGLTEKTGEAVFSGNGAEAN